MCGQSLKPRTTEPQIHYAASCLSKTASKSPCRLCGFPDLVTAAHLRGEVLQPWDHAGLHVRTLHLVGGTVEALQDGVSKQGSCIAAQRERNLSTESCTCLRLCLTQPLRRSHQLHPTCSTFREAGEWACPPATHAMDSVAEPLPALACTTSVPPSWVRFVRASSSSSLRVTLGVACTRSRQTPWASCAACPPWHHARPDKHAGEAVKKRALHRPELWPAKAV